LALMSCTKSFFIVYPLEWQKWNDEIKNCQWNSNFDCRLMQKRKLTNFSIWNVILKYIRNLY
jgi:hypothetical protein